MGENKIIMTEQRKKEAIKYIMSSLEDGYLDLGFHDQDELEIVREAMELLKLTIELSNIPLVGYFIDKDIAIESNTPSSQFTVNEDGTITFI